MKILHSKLAPITPREKKIRSVTLWGAFLNVVLMILKIVTGLLIKSSALIADGVHSLTDLATDLIILLGARLSSRPADETHPYGHRKFDTIASQMIAFFLVVIGFGFVFSAGTAIYRREVNYPGLLMLIVALVSVISKETIFHITRKVSRLTHSAALYANAWHHRSDSFSSMAVLIGGIASLLGWGYADHMAAIIVGIMIMGVAGKIFYDNLIELTEHSADKKSIQTIEKILSQAEDISGWHALRTRSLGGELFLDCHVIVDPNLTVLESHKIIDRIEEQIKRELLKPVNILIHIDPRKSNDQQ
ncbi:MAG: cation diffusion facilitator family transporter [Candidatus Aminicenantes bacterium]|jgi:cation diffusion facilitator family transporter